MSPKNLERDEELIKYAYENHSHIPKGDYYEKLISGMQYNFWEDDTITRSRLERHELVRRYGDITIFGKTTEEFTKERHEYLKRIFGKIPDEAGSIYIEPPFNVDYGYNISIGKQFYANFNMTILDSSIVRIGNGVLFGPNVLICCPTHDLNPIERVEKDAEWAKQITIEDNVWICGNVTVLQGDTIGYGSVIGANSVVNRDIPPMTVYAGTPAKFIKNVE